MSEAHNNGPAGGPSREQLDILFQALADGARREIIRRLTTETTIPKPDTVAAHHVHVPMLAEAGVVVDKDGVLTRGPRFRAARSLLAESGDA